MCRMCARRIRTHAEWNVAIRGARIPSGASSASTRRAISPAALFVNVTARTFFGCTPRTLRSHAIRWAMTRVFPLPAPASTRRGPSPAVTASRCGGFRSARRASRSSTRRLYRMPDGASWAVMRRPRRPAPIDRPPGARGGRGLFDRDALRQVAWLVDVAAEAHGDVVGEKLERDDGDERRQELGARRHLDDVLRLRRDVAVARVGHGDHEAVAGPHLLDVAEHALGRGVADHQRYHGELVGDERDRAVLHLTAGIALGMDVGNLLELERPLEGDGVLDATAQIEDVARVGELDVLYLGRDRKSTRLNSSHGYISYAVFCLKKKNNVTRMFRASPMLRAEIIQQLTLRDTNSPISSTNAGSSSNTHKRGRIACFTPEPADSCT